MDKEYVSFLEEFNDGLAFVAFTPPPTTFYGKMSMPSSQAFVHDIILSFWFSSCMYLVCLLYIITSHMQVGMFVLFMQPLLII